MATAGSLPAPDAGRGLPGLVAGGVAMLVVVGVVLIMGVVGAFVGLQPSDTAYGPSARADREIPPVYLKAYLAAGERYGIDPWVLAGIGWIETQHGSLDAPGVRSGVNAYGCCAGPMQFSVVGSRSTWDVYGVDGNGDGRRSPYDPEDAVPAAGRYLQALGGEDDIRRAIFGYNHANWYVDQVLAQAEIYRGQQVGGAAPAQPQGSASVKDVIGNRRVSLTPSQQADLRSGRVDPRVIDALAWAGRSHSIIVTSLRSDHSLLTVDGNRSNHGAGRAFDIGAVDGEACRGSREGACGQLALEYARVQGPGRATELIYCFDPDGPTDPRGFARADHCDHVHWGIDG